MDAVKWHRHRRSPELVATDLKRTLEIRMPSATVKLSHGVVIGVPANYFHLTWRGRYITFECAEREIIDSL